MRLLKEERPAIVDGARQTVEWLSVNHRPVVQRDASGAGEAQRTAPSLTVKDITDLLGTDADAQQVIKIVFTHAMARLHREYFLASQIRKEWLPEIKNVELVRLSDGDIPEHLAHCGQYWFIRYLNRQGNVVSLWMDQKCGGTSLNYVVSFDGQQWQLGPPGTGKERGWGPGIGSGFFGRPAGCPCVGRLN